MEQSDITKEYSLFDIILDIAKWKKFLIIITLIGFIISILIAFLLPKEYITYASIRGTAAQSLNLNSLIKGSGVGAGLSSFLDFAVPSGGSDADYFNALLKSKTVQDSLIKKFKLREKYETKTVEDTRLALEGNTDIKRDIPAEIIFIGVYDEDPIEAQKMTSYYIEMLNLLHIKLSSEAARNTRKHLEKRYNETFNELSFFEDSLKKYQEKYGVIDIYTQTSAVVEAAAKFKSQIILKEIELSNKTITQGPNSPDLIPIKQELEILNRNYNKIVTGSDYSLGQDVFIPFKKTPEVGLNYLRLYRQVQIYNEMIKVLLPLLEQAKIQELKETPNLVVIDYPSVPEKKSKPKRMLIVLFGTILSFVLGSTYAVTRINLENLKANNPDRYYKLKALTSFSKS